MRRRKFEPFYSETVRPVIALTDISNIRMTERHCCRCGRIFRCSENSTASFCHDLCRETPANWAKPNEKRIGNKINGSEVARRAGTTVNAISQLIRERIVKFEKIGRSNWFSPEETARIVDAKKNNPRGWVNALRGQNERSA